MKATEIILKYMDECGITYRGLAAMTGTSAQNVWNILNGRRGNRKDGEKGGREPDYKSILRICEVLGMKVSFLPTGGTPDPKVLEKTVELDKVPFSTVQSILKAGGWTVQISPPEKPLK